MVEEEKKKKKTTKKSATKKSGKKDGSTKKSKKSAGEHKEAGGKSEMEVQLEQALDATQKSLVSTRQRMEELVKANEDLTLQTQQQEKDALEVISALQKQADSRQSQIITLSKDLDEYKEQVKVEKEEMLKVFESKLAEVNQAVLDKDANLKLIQQEFAVIKDFRKKRHELVKELEFHKQELVNQEKRHKESISRMERKFFEEKLRLQREANRRITELATRAHQEAVSNLTDTTKEVYKDNLRMAEALKFHLEDSEELQKGNQQLSEKIKELAEFKDFHEVLMKEKILQAKQQEETIRDLQQKVVSLENALSHVVHEFEQERELIAKLARKELDEVRKVATQLKSKLDRRTQEMLYIRRLAQHVLDQRTDVERFFMESLDIVRKQAIKEREEARKNEQHDLNQKLRDHFKNRGAAPFPILKPLHGKPGNKFLPDEFIEDPHNSKLAQQQSQEAEQSLDIKDLNWEQKERVLRLLFAKMNGTSVLPPLDPKRKERLERLEQQQQRLLPQSHVLQREGDEVSYDEDYLDEEEYEGLHEDQNSNHQIEEQQAFSV